MPWKYNCIGIIFDEDFYYHGHLRWSYGWATPNFAGAFLAGFEPVIWLAAAIVYSKSHRKTAGFFQIATEFGFWFLLAKTYSRGSILAAFCARATWQAARGELTVIRAWAGYLMAPVVCIIASGFGGRIYQTVSTVDPSIEHRLEIWIAGLRMLAASPWTGWGAGQSGLIYMNWYERAGHDERFVTMANSYLNVAVEQGLFIFCLTIFVVGSLAYGGISAARSAVKAGRPAPALVLAATSATWVAWLTTNIFTTLYIIPSLWIVPGVAGCIIAGCRCTWQALGVRRTLKCGLSAIGACLLLFWAGTSLESRASVAVRPGKHGVIVLELQVRSPEVKRRPTIDIWPDVLVLGRNSGHQLRSWLEWPDGPACLIVHTADEVVDGGRGAAQGRRIAVFVGRQAARVQSLRGLPFDSTILLHPLQLSRDDFGCLRGRKAVIVIPEIDEAGTNEAIRREALDCGAKMVVSPGVGLDLQAVWPEIMVQANQAL